MKVGYKACTLIICLRGAVNVGYWGGGWMPMCSAYLITSPHYFAAKSQLDFFDLPKPLLRYLTQGIAIGGLGPSATSNCKMSLDKT